MKIKNIITDKIKAQWNNLPTDWYGINLRKAATWLVFGFIIGLGLMLSVEAKAEETTMEFAPTLFITGHRYNGGILFIEERWKSKYAIGLGVSTTWKCVDFNDCRRGEGKSNQLIYAQRVVQYKKFEVGIGISYWHNETPAWNSHTPFVLHIGWNFSKRASIKWRHFSTAGASSRNGGLDLLTGGYRF